MIRNDMMSRVAGKSIAFLCIVLFLFFSSCAYLKKEPIRVESKRTERDQTINVAQKYLDEGDFQKALETYNVAYNKYPHDYELRSNYIRIIHYIKKNADIAFNREDFAQAGFIYRVLLNNYADIKHLNSPASFDRDFLSNRVTTCSKTLNEKGLVNYREGNLEEAISIWEKILEFDPKNEDVKKSIATATTQLKTLQK